ncbi:TonB family protein, partial [Roseomonas aerophila]
RAAPPRPRSPFPGTLDLSRQPPMALAPPPPRGGVPRQSLPPGALDLSMGRVPQQRSVPGQQNLNSNMSHVAGAQASGSWNGAFMSWVRNRSFYPRQAAENGDDGEVMVQVVIERSGRVRSVELRRRSGSMFLDMGLQSIFRNQTVPPFTPDMEGDTMTMNFTMRYILLYR